MLDCDGLSASNVQRGAALAGGDRRAKQPLMAMLHRIERQLAMLRHVPPRQVARRLELAVYRRLASTFARPGEPLPETPRLPLPCLPERSHLATPLVAGWRLWQPWGSMDVTTPIDWRLPGDDPETTMWRINLHYMEFLEAVDDAALMTVVEDWIDNNPLAAREARACGWWPYNLSIRTVVWMQQIARRRARLDDRFRRKAATSLVQQLRFLERHLETDLRGNHLVRNLKALLWGAAFFTGAEAERWRRRGLALLEAELAHQILADGCHYERSPSYHCQVFGDLLEIVTVLDPGPRRERLREILNRMAVACVAFTHPDGQVALFNDSGLQMAYRPALLLAAQAAAGGQLAACGDGPFALPDAGYYGLRAGDTYLIVDCGPVGPDELIGHAHGDVLSFEWSVAGRRMIVDQGTFQYAAGPCRDTSRNTASHNTVTIDGAEQCDFFDAHRCGRRPRVTVLQHRPTAAGFVLEGTHDGFAHLPHRPRHVRLLTATPDRLEIRDRIESSGSNTAEAGLLLHPDCRVTIAAGRATVATETTTVMIESSAAITAESAEWFPELHASRPTTRLRMTFAGAGATLETILQRQR